MQFIKRETAMQKIKVAGVEYPAIYNFSAIATMEDVTETPHKYSIPRILLGVPTATDFIGCLLGVLIAAGVEVTKDDLISSIAPDEEGKILEQLRQLFQTSQLNRIRMRARTKKQKTLKPR